MGLGSGVESMYALLYLQLIWKSAWVGPSFPDSRKRCEHFICVAGQGSSLIICIGILKGYSESLFKMISNLQRMWYFGVPTTLVLLWFHEWQLMHSLVFVHGWSQIEFSWVRKLLFFWISYWHSISIALKFRRASYESIKEHSFLVISFGCWANLVFYCSVYIDSLW